MDFKDNLKGGKKPCSRCGVIFKGGSRTAKYCDKCWMPGRGIAGKVKNEKA